LPDDDPQDEQVEADPDHEEESTPAEPADEDRQDKPPRARRATTPKVDRPYPRKTLEQALRVPRAIKEHNGGKPWASEEVARALNVGPKTGGFWYITAASRDFGLTEGTRETATIELTELGSRAVYPHSEEQERQALLEAFFNIDVFRRVVEHFGGSNLPDPKFRENTLQQTFGLDPATHDEFVDLFQKNARFVGIGADYQQAGAAARSESTPLLAGQPQQRASITVAEPAKGTAAPVCFIIMPFEEHDDRYPTGFFEEVLESLFIPAATEAGFTVVTAKRQGSDVIQSTIVNELLAADLVLADLTEHNPNVLFELGMRMADERPVALVRAKGTGAIFDVDNMLRVESYNPNMWPSTVAKDVPRLTEHIKATWDNRDSAPTYLGILRQQRQP